MTPEPTFADLGEDRIVARILARIPDAQHVLIGPGDDAAVSESPGRLVSTADMLVEGEDFLQGWLDPVRLGVKAAAQNLADVRAMGAAPTGLLLSLAAPGGTPASFVDGLVDGLVEEAGRAGASVMGGDLSEAGQIVIAVTAFGSLPVYRFPFTRDAAEDGFDVLLGGQTGWAAAGLDLLLASGGTSSLPEGDRVREGVSPLLERAIEAQRAPRPDYGCIDRLRTALDLSDRDSQSHGSAQSHETDQVRGDSQTHGHAALIDLSDGLASDAGRMARASGVVIDLDAEVIDRLARELLPVAAHVCALHDVASRTEDGSDDDRALDLARRWVLTGGEDHGFLAAVPHGTNPLGWTRIGRVRADAHAPGVQVAGASLEESGFATAAPDGGYRHFSGVGE